VAVYSEDSSNPLSPHLRQDYGGQIKLQTGTAYFAHAGDEESPPFTRLNFLSENFGGQEFGKAAEPHR